MNFKDLKNNHDLKVSNRWIPYTIATCSAVALYTVLNNLLVGGNPRMSTLIRICKALDCKLMIREDTKYIELTLEDKQ